MKNFDCHEVEELILTDLDEGLNQDKRVILERHLAECAACRKTWDETRLLLSEIASDVPEDPGEAFWRNYQISLEARLRDRENSGSWNWGFRSWGFWWKTAGAFALAALILMVVSVGVFRHWSAPPSMEVSSVSSDLISDLDQLYGPVLAEEVTYSHGFDTEDAHLSGSILVTSDDPFGEFDVEDETNPLFL